MDNAMKVPKSKREPVWFPIDPAWVSELEVGSTIHIALCGKLVNLTVAEGEYARSEGRLEVSDVYVIDGVEKKNPFEELTNDEDD